MIKVLFEIYKVLGRMGIKPKDVIGMGGNIVKMGKSLFNTRPNPKLLTFIEKNQKIPTKILEEIKLHARTLKNASENQKNLFLENIKSIEKAKTVIKPEIVPKKGMFDNIFTKMYREAMGPPKVVKPKLKIEKSKQIIEGMKPKAPKVVNIGDRIIKQMQKEGKTVKFDDLLRIYGKKPPHLKADGGRIDKALPKRSRDI